MENFSISSIIRSIKNLLGEGPHFLHEPSMGKKETKYVSETIKNNFVSELLSNKVVESYSQD